MLRYLALAVAAWLGVSLAVFLVSAQIQEAKAPGAAERALDVGGPMPFVPNTILVLGSDARPKGTGEDGANVVGQPSRADTIMLVRAGGLSSARLSIPRDTVMDIPGHGPDKVNAAYAIGGPALTVTTIKQYLGLDINHVIEVDFANFPVFIDALGGVNVRTGRVCAAAGRRRRTTVAPRSTCARRPTTSTGRQALALARARKNTCNPSEDDRDRAGAPAGDPGRDQEPARLPRHLRPPAAGLMGRAAGDPHRHERPHPAGAVRRGPGGRHAAHAGAGLRHRGRHHHLRRAARACRCPRRSAARR